MKGRPCFILGSGPSLTAEDIEAVKSTGLPTIAVNSTWRAAPFCSVIYAGDKKWWSAHIKEIDVPAKRVTFSGAAARLYGLKHHRRKLVNGYNSGMLAIDYALQKKASRVILLGYDCSIVNGIHHHGPHEQTHNPTAKRCDIWRLQFKYIADLHKGADVVNCSRYTELKAFPVDTLENVICGLS
jgi:hypothetical protein